MTAINEHTGDRIQTGVPSEAYMNHFDNIDWSKPLNESSNDTTTDDLATERELGSSSEDPQLNEEICI